MASSSRMVSPLSMGFLTLALPCWLQCVHGCPHLGSDSPISVVGTGGAVHDQFAVPSIGAIY